MMGSGEWEYCRDEVILVVHERLLLGVPGARGSRLKVRTREF